MRMLFTLSILAVSLLAQLHARVTQQNQQAIVGVADGWNSSHVQLSLLERNKHGLWERVMGPYAGRLGRKGLVWGHGLHQNPRGARTKVEGDGRTPAGVFALGGLYTTTKKTVQRDRHMPHLRVGPADLWVSDTAMPHLYNRHVRLKHPARSAWEKKEQMRQNDYPHSIKLLIHHNTDYTRNRAPINGAGSSIFFHIWRNQGASPTAGCTTMDEAVLRAMISRLKPRKNPVYIVLPRKEYMSYRRAWHLP